MGDSGGSRDAGGSAMDRLVDQARGASADPATTSTRRVLTVPNLISFARILLIPVFVVLLTREGTEYAGLALLCFVVSTDWVDGWLARKTGQVSELGKLLDPIADRLALGAALVTFVVRDVFPLWAALLVLVRDGLILLIGLALLGKGVRLDVRYLGKVATFTLMGAIPAIAWGGFGLVLAPTFLAIGWVWFAVGIAEYYLATGLYLGDMARALRSQGAVERRG